jgi:hypothetical protein
MVDEKRVLELRARIESYLSSHRGRLALVTLERLFRKDGGRFAGYNYAWHILVNSLKKGDKVVDSLGSEWTVKRVLYKNTRRNIIHVYFTREDTGKSRGVTELSHEAVTNSVE